MDRLNYIVQGFPIDGEQRWYDEARCHSQLDAIMIMERHRKDSNPRYGWRIVERTYKDTEIK